MTLLKIVTAILSVLLVFWGFFAIITSMFSISNMVIGVYQGIFGAVMFLSLFDFRVIDKNMYILKSTRGKGAFCLFLSSTFLIKN